MRSTPSWPDPDDTLLVRLARTLNLTLGQPQGAALTPDGAAVIFRRSEPDSMVSDLFELTLETGEERTLLTASQLLGGAEEQLSPEERARRERARLATRGVVSFSMSDDGATLLIPLSGRLYLLDRRTGAHRLLPTSSPALDASLSPDGRRLAYVVRGDLYTLDLQRDAETRLTHREHEAVHSGAAEFVAQEEMHRAYGYAWAPDSTRLLVQRTDERPVEILYIADPTHPEREPAAHRYPRAGRDNAVVALDVVDVHSGARTPIAWDAAAWPYLARFAWPRRGRPTILVQSRTQTEARLYAVDPESGALTELLTESDEAWLNLDGHLPLWVMDGAAFLWSTERSGAWALELRGADGALIRTLTDPGFGYHSTAGLDPRGDAALVLAHPDPLERHVWRVPLDGSAPSRLTEAPGLHAASSGGGRALVSALHADGSARWSVRGRDGVEVANLRDRSDPIPVRPNTEITWVDVPGRRLATAITRPQRYEPGRRYPVLVYVYGGPHVNVVMHNPRLYLRDQWLADGGFVVVRIEGRGTPGRGRAWERSVHRDLVSNALADQADGLRALGERYAELDLSRVGVTGWSFGGYLSAMAVLLRPDVFHAAAAGAPVTDWLDYDTHYTERYMGLPQDNGSGYAHTSALTHAAGLRRPLLLIHGTTDDNVFFTHSLKLSEALFKAGKEVELLALPGFTHMVPDPAVKVALDRRILNFIRRNLDDDQII